MGQDLMAFNVPFSLCELCTIFIQTEIPLYIGRGEGEKTSSLHPYVEPVPLTC